MKHTAIALAAGVLFGAGLALSGMADPAVVRAFLDLFGAWNPALLFVMGGALIPMAIAWRCQRRLPRPLADSRFNLPDTRKIDASLLTGAAIFGIGWGIGGICPGPALADLAIAPVPATLFILSMIVGMALFAAFQRLKTTRKPVS